MVIELNGKPFKPLLAAPADVFTCPFPAGVTPKLDGLRVVIIDGQPKTRSLKRVKNKNILETLRGIPHMFDGEIIANTNTFQDSTTAVMKVDAETPWTYYVFDLVLPDQPNAPYTTRINKLREIFETEALPPQLKLLEPTYVHERTHLEELVQMHLARGYEGTIVREPSSPNKCGRRTLREGYLLKIKTFEDDEAKIVGFEELMSNQNEATINALGLTERSSHKENKVPANMLGAFVVEALKDPTKIFKVGSGFTHAQRVEIWNNRELYLGKILKYKHFPQGVKSLPRHPIYLGIRDPDDMSI